LARLYHHIGRKAKSQAIVDRLARLGYLIPDLPPPSSREEENAEESAQVTGETAAVNVVRPEQPTANGLGEEIGPVAKGFDLRDLDAAVVTKN